MLKIRIVPLFMILLMSCNKPNKSDTQTAVINKTQINAAKIYPHSESFKLKEHGAKFIEDRALCASCHGLDNSGGTAQVSCTKCHSNYPHIAGWSVPQKHGKFFVESVGTEKQACLNCHNPSSSSGAVSCQTCHKAFPHSEEFDGHGGWATSYEGKCTSCHTDFKRLMPKYEPKGCVYCHSDSTLSIGWVKSTPSSADVGHPNDIKRATASKPVLKKHIKK